MTETADKEKQELHASLTIGAHDRIHDFAAREGFTVTSFLEELSTRLDDPFALTLVSGARIRTAKTRRRKRKTDEAQEV